MPVIDFASSTTTESMNSTSTVPSTDMSDTPHSQPSRLNISLPYIKREPDDDYVTDGMYHPFQSVGRERAEEVKRNSFYIDVSTIPDSLRNTEESDNHMEESATPVMAENTNSSESSGIDNEKVYEDGNEKFNSDSEGESYPNVSSMPVFPRNMVSYGGVPDPKIFPVMMKVKSEPLSDSEFNGNDMSSAEVLDTTLTNTDFRTETNYTREHFQMVTDIMDTGKGVVTTPGSSSKMPDYEQDCELPSTSYQASDEPSLDPLTCPLCKKTFLRETYLKTHMLLHENTRKHACGLCSKTFIWACHLRRHMLLHTNQRPFACDECGKAFSDPGVLKQHKLIHTGEKPFVCDVCEKSFLRECHLRQHKMIHDGEKPYVCDICSKAFSCSSNMRKHRRKHSDYKPFACDSCSKSFAALADLKRHMMIHSDRRFACDMCTKTYTNSSDLKVHRLTHTAERLFQCEVCTKSFFHQHELTKHMTIHAEEKPFACDVCDRRFHRTEYLRQHKLVHSDERPFACGVCNKTYTRADTLKQHERNHSGFKPFACIVCLKTFTRAETLRQHIQKKICQKWVCCDVCGATFRRVGQLKEHKKSHAGKKQLTCDMCRKAFTAPDHQKPSLTTGNNQELVLCDKCCDKSGQASPTKKGDTTLTLSPQACDDTEQTTHDETEQLQEESEGDSP